MGHSSPTISLRVSAAERSILEGAAAAEHTSLSDFVRRKALEAAERELMDRRVVTISADQWAEFETMLAAPPTSTPALRKLARLERQAE